MLIPPLNWGLVERGFSRSAFPSPLNLPFLQKQKLRTLILLDEERQQHSQLDPELVSFLHANSVDLVQIGGAPAEEADADVDSDERTTDGGSGGSGKERDGKSGSGSSKGYAGSWKPTSEELVLSALRLVLDPARYPVHLMCSSSGRHLTGVVVGCFRKLQRWSLSSIFAEYRRYAGGGSRGADSDAGGEASQLVMNEQFIELFDVELLADTLGQRNIQRHLRSINVHTQGLGTTGGGGGGGGTGSTSGSSGNSGAGTQSLLSSGGNAGSIKSDADGKDKKQHHPLIQQQQQQQMASRAQTPSSPPGVVSAVSSPVPAPRPMMSAALPLTGPAPVATHPAASALSLAAVAAGSAGAAALSPITVGPPAHVHPATHPAATALQPAATPAAAATLAPP